MMDYGSGTYTQYGEAAVDFANGSTLTAQQLINMADTASTTNTLLYGFRAAGTFYLWEGGIIGEAKVV